MRVGIIAGAVLVVSVSPGCHSADVQPPGGAEVDGSAPRTDATPGAPDASPGAPDAGSSDIEACGTLGFTTSLALAPAAAGQRYVRCESRGPETGARVALADDGGHLAVITTSGTARLFATDPWAEVAQLAVPVGRIDAIAFSPDGATLATLSAEMGLVTLWSTADGTRGQSFAAAPAPFDTYASTLTYSPDGSRLATSLGTVIDADDGTPIATVPGGTILRFAFAPGNDVLFEELAYQIGNSPQSTWLSLRTLSTGAQTDLFKAYSRALTGYAVSADGTRVALAKTEEATTGGFAPGLSIYATDTAAEIASDPTFTGTVLGFSRDGARLFTTDAGTVTVLDTADLHVVDSFAWPATPADFLGVSPEDDLVASSGGTTSWWAADGTIRQSLPLALTQATWTTDGRHGGGTGDPDAFFAMWREADAAPLCTPAPQGGTAPTLASLGTVLAGDGPTLSSDGSIALTNVFVIHTHATDYTAVHVTETATGNDLRVFSPSPTSRAIAMSDPSAAELYTVEGTAVAVWCD
jgi:hypothetical protein